jgi:hypothetical protein
MLRRVIMAVSTGGLGPYTHESRNGLQLGAAGKSTDDGDTMKWIVFGDSHVATIAWASQNGVLIWPAEFINVGGATAVWLRNPNSLTSALQTFADRLLPPVADAVPVMHLGEVDCGFVIWYRAAKYCESIEAQLEASVAAHVAFVDRLLAAGYPMVVLTGASLPTVPDGQVWGEVANRRRDVVVPRAERTALTLKYTARLSEAARQRSQPFVDIAGYVLDAATGEVRPEFMNDNPTDHHLNPSRAGPLWAAGLNEISDRWRRVEP